MDTSSITFICLLSTNSQNLNGFQTICTILFTIYCNCYHCGWNHHHHSGGLPQLPKWSPWFQHWLLYSLFSIAAWLTLINKVSCCHSSAFPIYLHVTLNNSSVEHLFMYLFDIISSLEKWLFKSFAYFNFNCASLFFVVFGFLILYKLLTYFGHLFLIR